MNHGAWAAATPACVQECLNHAAFRCAAWSRGSPNNPPRCLQCIDGTVMINSTVHGVYDNTRKTSGSAHGNSASTAWAHALLVGEGAKMPAD